MTLTTTVSIHISSSLVKDPFSFIVHNDMLPKKGTFLVKPTIVFDFIMTLNFDFDFERITFFRQER